NILSPLGLDDTFPVLGDADLTRMARGYWDGVDYTEQDYTMPGGSMVSTAEDIGVFLRALVSGSLMNIVERQRYESLFDGYGHSGWLPGYQSRSRRVPGADVVVVLFANTTGGDSERVTDEVFDALVRRVSAGTR
ncbi:MAG: serine hydrolase, partial [Pseudomonadota bacterium]